MEPQKISFYNNFYYKKLNFWINSIFLCSICLFLLVFFCSSSPVFSKPSQSTAQSKAQPKAQSKEQSKAQSKLQPKTQPKNSPPKSVSISSVASVANKAKKPVENGKTHINGIRIWPSPESTRVVLDLNGPVQFEQKENKNSDGQSEVILYIQNAVLKAELSQSVLKHTRIKRMRSEIMNNTQLVFKLILEKPLKPNVFSLLPNQEYGHRLVIDLEDETAIQAEAEAAAHDSLDAKAPLFASVGEGVGEKEAILALFSEDSPSVMTTAPASPASSASSSASATRPKASSNTTSKTASSKPASKPSSSFATSPTSASTSAGAASTARKLDSTQTPATLAQTSHHKKHFIVAIDAGHGGEDPGAIGRNGTREKDVVLAISKHLKGMIDKEPGMKAVLIRSGDYYVGLKDRMSRARNHKADLFVSVHADAFQDRRAEGASVFTLSEHGASSTAAKWIADRENRSDLIGGVKLSNKNKVLASVLLDLTQSASKEEGLKAARHVLQSLGKVGSLHRGKVEQAGFAVLKAPDVPSMLVETGFISHPATERKLKTAAYQKKIAAAIMGGIRQYAGTRSH